MSLKEWVGFSLAFLVLLAIPVVAAHGADPLQHKSWGISQVKAAEAWRVTPGSRSIVVAIIDTGIDIAHADLRDNIWKNLGESGLDSLGRSRESNGLDDDRNGFIDDVHGWNFVDDNNDVIDRHGHGTHVAGIVGARGQNGIGTAGVASRVSLMALKYYDPGRNESDNLANTIRAIRYATKMNADVINYSGGGFSKSPTEEQAIRDAGEKGIVLVAAAGNERINSDIFGFYPADYGLPNVISVTAIDRETKFLDTSNYGRRSVHIAAPGKDIYSTLPRQRYGIMTGTSQSTAFVSGAMALLMAREPNVQNPQRLIHTLLLSGDYNRSLNGKTRFETTLNVARMMWMQDNKAAADNRLMDESEKVMTPLSQVASMLQSLLRAPASDQGASTPLH